MSEPCIHCGMVLTVRERQEGWCESCGKKLPTWLRGGPARQDETPAARPAGRRGFFMTFVLLLPCFGLGAAIALAITGGKTTGGFNGIMAGIGIGVAYASGVLPGKNAKAQQSAH